MCGITGFFHPDPTFLTDSDLLRQMNDSILHRSPDSEGYFLQGNLGMGVRRLAIIDRFGGDQPVFNEDGQIAITNNGEIYNFFELRPLLEILGQVCMTHNELRAWSQELLLENLAHGVWFDTITIQNCWMIKYRAGPTQQTFLGAANLDTVVRTM
jgi:asparagine synthetase B (glutamine-hydrolysing)